MDTQKSKTEKINESPEKRNWVSPEISNWENDNIEFAGGIGADGGTKAYVA
ncbi:hypothetical protein G9H65_09475 [Cytophagaceae bacterium 50A-KIRBA]|uniref:hypothetical protein n=1 Tax=Aquirufa ecclesiirivi TaxID=2715124 RepID=UPI0014089496|nr:hypothetical protein [Aquirufa ecclesiirivi]NHC49564.1 hypothetical protein [Aquirufa ecclesiirivi]